MKKSKVFSLKGFFSDIYKFCCTVTEDMLSVYSAQATFFIIIASIPFLLLLLSLTKYFIDGDWILSLIEEYIMGDAGQLLTSIVREILEKGGIPLLSVTVFTTLWTTSRGVNSVVRGVSEIYGIKIRENFLLDIGRSLIYTVAFIFIIIGVLVAIIFSETIANMAREQIPLLSTIFDIVDDSSTVVFVMVLTLFFALLFNTVSKKGKRLAKTEYENTKDKMPHGFAAQLPGAAFAAVGWMIFSQIYKWYISYFPSASYVYGSLAAVVFMILWMYFCVMILMFGAEINKMIFIVKRRRNRRKEQLKLKSE